MDRKILSYLYSIFQTRNGRRRPRALASGFLHTRTASPVRPPRALPLEIAWNILLRSRPAALERDRSVNARASAGKRPVRQRTAGRASAGVEYADREQTDGSIGPERGGRADGHWRIRNATYARVVPCTGTVVGSTSRRKCNDRAVLGCLRFTLRLIASQKLIRSRMKAFSNEGFTSRWCCTLLLNATCSRQR